MRVPRVASSVTIMQGFPNRSWTLFGYYDLILELYEQQTESCISEYFLFLKYVYAFRSKSGISNPQHMYQSMLHEDIFIWHVHLKTEGREEVGAALQQQGSGPLQLPYHCQEQTKLGLCRPQYSGLRPFCHLLQAAQGLRQAAEA